MKNATIFPLLLLCAGCAAAGGGLTPGVSREADVLAAMGRPAVEYRDADGSRTLAYPHGPMGTVTYLAEIGPDGRLRAVRQALTDDTFQRVVPGMTRGEVLRLIGPPRDAVDFPNLDRESWEYRFVDTWGYEALFSVDFDRQGRVVGKFTRRLDRRERLLF